ncbi:hypothetical protein BCR39DRAFT_552280 [Naematelia encephala]|uniref:ubiquitinyl hydrolase 1 n=1 Tax=Naematelia encephala TaxID=71784 RepID=A0A1Y2AHS4_9TREE|nr:hypothetical protein BCR39DRAFT_552280 [Naematelia encephala]
MSATQLAPQGAYLAELLANPIAFTQPFTNTALGNTFGTIEVQPGPPSPRRRHTPLQPQQQKQQSQQSHVSTPENSRVASASSSSSRVQLGSESKSLQSPQSLTPSRKGKEPESLYSADIDLTWPAPISSRKAGAAGLQNPSMACYANATLQVLLHTPPFLRISLMHEGADCLQARKGFCMLCELHELVVQKHWKGQRSYMPSNIHRNLGQIKKGFNRNRQEDAHEFFRFVTDSFQNNALARYPKDIPAKIKHTTWVYKLWGGTVRSRVVCSRCQKPSDTFDDFLDLSLDVNHKDKSLLGMLKGFIREDKLEGDNKYHCENCKSKASATKSFKILNAPPVLTFHLKRFSVNYGFGGRARADKFNQHIEFGEWLDIAPYMVDPKSQSGPSTKYRLYAVTCHRGVELRFGHYTSYVKGPQGAWFNADDDDMSPVSLSTVLHDKTAYLLWYMRVEDGDFDIGKKINGSTSSPARPLTNGSHSNGPSPIVGNRSQPTLQQTSDKKNTSMIGPRLPDSNSPVKRKRQDDEEEEEETPERHPSKFSRNSFISTTAPTPTIPLIKSSPLNNTPSRENSEDDRIHSKFTYTSEKNSTPKVLHPRPRDFDFNTRDSPIQRPGHPSPGGGRKKDRKKDRDGKKFKGPPMPFNQGRSGNGGGGGGGRSWGGKPNGIVKSMKSRRPLG